MTHEERIKNFKATINSAGAGFSHERDELHVWIHEQREGHALLEVAR